MSPSQPNPRSYRSAVRAEQACATRRRILDAAYACFVRDGYPGTTMAAIAQAAGVSPQTVYNVFTSKAVLLKAVYDVTLVGDDEPVPFAQRPEVAQVYASTSPRQFLTGYAGLGLLLFGRLEALLAAIVEGAAAGDEDLRAHVRTIDGERLVGAGMVAGVLADRRWLRDGVTHDHARDVIWTLDSLSVYEMLVHQRGWSPQAYVEWLGDTWTAALAKPEPPPAGG